VNLVAKHALSNLLLNKRVVRNTRHHGTALPDTCLVQKVDMLAITKVSDAQRTPLQDAPTCVERVAASNRDAEHAASARGALTSLACGDSARSALCSLPRLAHVVALLAYPRAVVRITCYVYAEGRRVGALGAHAGPLIVAHAASKRLRSVHEWSVLAAGF
jgi:hypothetical protein